MCIRDRNVCAYLGFRIGPGASVADQWQEPLAKHRARAVDISSSGAPVSVMASLYRERAVP
eukprot:971546-Pyramimonas_sp.AAC.1